MGYRTLKIPPPPKKRDSIKKKKVSEIRTGNSKVFPVSSLQEKKNEETGSNTKSKLDNGYQTLDNLGIQ